MSAWEEIVRAVVLGTERQPFKMPPSGGALGDTLTRIEARADESGLLDATAAATQYQRSGKLPAKLAAGAINPAPEEDLPRVSTRSGQHLQIMLEGRYANALDEWLDTAAALGKRVPEEYLPALLNWGTRMTMKRESILKVIGERGRWLAALNPQWSYAIAGLDISEWETTSGPARVLILRLARSGDPAQGRALLESTWETENANDRASFVDELGHGLSMADEPFLETCLDDRSKSVREVAAAVLSRLPESRLVKRMIARLEDRIVLKGGSKPTFEVNLPDECDESMIRDGINQKPSDQYKNLGEKAQWVLQMIQRVPPGYWSDKWGKSPVDLIGAATRSKDWTELLLRGWVDATTMHPEGDWPQALYSHQPNEWLLNQLPTERREAVVTALVQTISHDEAFHIFKLMSSVPRPWSTEFAVFAMGKVKAQIARSRKDPDARLLRTLFGFAYQFPVEMEDLARKTLALKSSEESDWRASIQEFMAVLNFRREMLEELQR